MLKKILIVSLIGIASTLSVCMSALAVDTFTPKVAAEYVANQFEKEWREYLTSKKVNCNTLKTQPLEEFAFQTKLTHNHSFMLTNNVESYPVDNTSVYYSSLNNSLVSQINYVAINNKNRAIDVSFDKLSDWQHQRLPHYSFE